MIKFKNDIIQLSLRLSFLLLAGQLVTLIFFYRRLPPQIPLFYSRSWGEKQLAPPLLLFLIPALSLGVTMINIFFTIIFTKNEKLVGQFLGIFSSIFNFLCLVTLLKIIFLIT
ncbi:hypothetical protein ACFL0Y_02720 [Patescibacteria group bacterium]